MEAQACRRIECTGPANACNLTSSYPSPQELLPLPFPQSSGDPAYPYPPPIYSPPQPPFPSCGHPPTHRPSFLPSHLPPLLPAQHF